MLMGVGLRGERGLRRAREVVPKFEHFGLIKQGRIHLVLSADFCEYTENGSGNVRNILEGGRSMNAIRKAGWFFSLALMMAGVIASRGTDGVAARDADMIKVQTFLEQKIVLQKLTDYGVSAEEAMAKIRAMSDSDVHRLASLTDRAAAGADSGLGILIGLAILIILIIVILKLMHKEVIVR